MSAVTDNQTFLTNVLGAGNVDFTNKVYGLWVSTFQNLNLSSNGYSYPQPLIQDFLSINYPVTGKRFTVFNLDGKAPDVKFFVTEAEKGINYYNTNYIAADISDSFISSEDPAIIMPDMDYSGKIYRRYEITGLVKSVNSNLNTLNISGEDWQDTSIAVSASGTNQEKIYSDTSYIGYSNEVQTKYKFLYDNADYSIDDRLSIFDIPTQVEPGANIKYRISRQSDPLGTYTTPEITSDGKMIIDYSQFEDDVTKIVDTNVDYEFSPVGSIVKFTKEDLDESSSTKEISSEESIHQIKILQEGDRYVVKMIPSGGQSFSGIYRLNLNLNKYDVNLSGGTAEGYVLTGQNLDGSTNEITNLQSGDAVYPRNIKTEGYNTDSFLDLVNQAELEFNEQLEADLNADFSITTEDEGIQGDNDLFNSLNSYYNAYAEAVGESNEVVRNNLNVVDRSFIDSWEKTDQFQNNYKTPLFKVTSLPNLSLPKLEIDKNYYSNYLNSGEEYLAIPAIEYSRSDNYIYYGNNYGILGYVIGANGNETYRMPINSTSNGVFINETGLCIGDSAIYSNAVSNDNVKFLTGEDLHIPESDGVIKKQNFSNIQNWKDGINYFYTKTQLDSCDIFPTDSEQTRKEVIAHAIGRAEGAVTNAAGEFANKKPRIFAERLIYVEPFDINQSDLLTSATGSEGDDGANFELQDFDAEKLYGIQTFDIGFCDNKEDYFYASNYYNEKISFSHFTPYKNASGDVINSYSTENILSTKDQGLKVGDDILYRIEYVSGNTFSYQDLSSDYSVWQGTSGDAIPNITQNTSRYAYHLYGYNAAADVLTFYKSNIAPTGEIANVTTAYATVLKFEKNNFTQSVYKDSENENKTSFSLQINNSNNNPVASNKLFFNIQSYDYKVTKVESKPNWFSNKKHPYNDDTYGQDENLNLYGLSAPRFFEDASEDRKRLGNSLLILPNGPLTSKNFEGSPVNSSNINAFQNSLFKNTFSIAEERQGAGVTYSNRFILNLNQNSGFVKERGLIRSTNFSQVNRLKVSRVRYNFYIKDLTILGDAGFPYAIDLNTAWEYRLQYRQGNSSWIELSNSTSLGNSKIQTTFEFLNEYFYNSQDLTRRFHLHTVAFKTNLSRFLDDKNYEFRIFKYQKLVSPFDSVNIINKTNFLPSTVSWDQNNNVEYYNIYQVDRDRNYTLLDSVGYSSSKYVLPRIKQSLVNLGVDNTFSGGTNYYDIAVSGVLPAVDTEDESVSSSFGGVKIGNDTNGQEYNIKLNKNQQYSNQYTSISNVQHSPVISFENKEFKESNFDITFNHDGYYFVTSGANATLTDNSNDLDFYVVNIGSGCNLITGSTTTAINQNDGVYVNGQTQTSYSLQSASSQLNVSNGDFVILDSNTTINSLSSSTIDAYFINNSSSTITITNGSDTEDIEANKTEKFQLGANSITSLVTFDNVAPNSTSITSNRNLVNFNHSSLTVLPNTDEIGVYNFATNDLSVNGSLTLEPDSFYLVSRVGSGTPTAVKKEYFDDLKIFIDGTEEQPNYYLVDDTTINLTNFSPRNQTKDYIFVKSAAIERNLNVKVVKGSSVEYLSSDAVAFKINVSKINGNISYKVSYASETLAIAISDSKEQFAVLRDGFSDIDFDYIQNSLPTNSFVYVLNESSKQVDLYNVEGDMPKNIPPGGVIKFFQDKKQEGSSVSVAAIDKNNSARLVCSLQTKMKFDSTINIANLRSCDTVVSMNQSSLLSNKENFIIQKNNFIVNNYESLAGDADNNYTLRLLNSNGDATIEQADQINFLKDFYNSNADFSCIYIEEDNLNSTAIRREKNKSEEGYLFLSSPRKFNISSFDEINTKTFSKGQSFYFNSNASSNGILEVEATGGRKNIAIYNTKYIYGSNTASMIVSGLVADQYIINFCLDFVSIGSVNAYKNRMLNSSGYTFPIYNVKEFFIAETAASGARSSYEYSNKFWYDYNPDSDIESVILPQSFGSKSIVIRNFSGRPLSIITIFNNNVLATANPNQEVTVSFGGVNWTSSTSSITALNQQPLNIHSSQQATEVDITHPLVPFTEQNGIKTADPNFIANFSKNILSLFTPEEDNFGEFSDEKTNININNTSHDIVDVDLSSATFTVPNSNKSVFCFGRKGFEIDGSNNVDVNNLYLYQPYNVTQNNNQFNAEKGFLFKGSALLKDEYNERNPVELKYLKRELFDLTSIVYYASPVLEYDVIFVPFYRELTTFYLPNLSYSPEFGYTVEDFLLPQGLTPKKIVFVNLVKSNQNAENIIYNYSNQQEIKLTKLNETATFYIDNSAWVLEEENPIIVQNINASLGGAKGKANKDFDSTIQSDGKDFFQLQNIDSLDISINSFTNNQFGDFYLYSKSLKSLSVSVQGRPYQKIPLSVFNKMTFDGNVYSAIPMQFGTSSNFAIYNQNEEYESSPIGTLILKGENVHEKGEDDDGTIESWKSLPFYGYEGNSTDGTAVLGVLDLKSLDSDSKVFIYGSSRQNGNFQAFDKYNLKLLNINDVDYFFIFNNTIENASILVGESNFQIPPLRMVKVTSSLVEYFEQHERGSFYLTHKDSNKNYVTTTNQKLFIDGALDIKVSGNKLITTKITDITPNVLVTCNVDNLNSIDFNRAYYASESDLLSLSQTVNAGANFEFFAATSTVLTNKKGYDLSSGTNFLVSKFSEKNLNLVENVISSSGHYLFDSSNEKIKINSISGAVYAINNSGKDIILQDENTVKTLYRNTVYYKNGSSFKYIKKSKQKDEFYSIFSPRTAISTERELSLSYNIQKHREILPVFDLNFIGQPSYVKLLSSSGEETLITLSLENFYKGIDIPSISSDISAYEVGIGHETIYKFKFFDPSSNLYTLSGLKKGKTYLVETDESLFLNEFLDSPYGNIPQGKVRYMGIDYSNQKTFKAGDSTWFEINYPDYVKLTEVISELPAASERTYELEQEIGIDPNDASIINAENFDDLARLKELVTNSLQTKVEGSNFCWIPNGKEAFWLDSQTLDKDLWKVESIDTSKTITISDNQNRQISLVKCSLKKSDLKSTILNYNFTYYTGLQDRLPLSDTGDITIGFDYNLTPSQKGKFKNSVIADYNKKDLLNSSGKEVVLGSISRDVLYPEDDVATAIRNSEFEITLELQKLDQMPSINVEDFSNNQIVKLLNGE